MAIRQIRIKGDELLRKKARPIDKISKSIKVLLDDMAETMYEDNGVGLAAPQVGILRRAVVIDVEDDNGLIKMINPVILEKEGEQINSEGCLSIPGESGYVKRPQRVKVKFIDEEGYECELEGTGLLAIAMCHEIDHLDGVLYIDKVLADYVPPEKSQE